MAGRKRRQPKTAKKSCQACGDCEKTPILTQPGVVETTGLNDVPSRTGLEEQVPVAPVSRISLNETFVTTTNPVVTQAGLVSSSGSTLMTAVPQTVVTQAGLVSSSGSTLMTAVPHTVVTSVPRTAMTPGILNSRDFVTAHTPSPEFSTHPTTGYGNFPDYPPVNQSPVRSNVYGPGQLRDDLRLPTDVLGRSTFAMEQPPLPYDRRDRSDVRLPTYVQGRSNYTAMEQQPLPYDRRDRGDARFPTYRLDQADLIEMDRRRRPYDRNETTRRTEPHIYNRSRSSSLASCHSLDDNDVERWCQNSEDEIVERRRRSDRPKLPPFRDNTKESWEAWFNRFSDVAQRYRWTEEQKLDNLLPQLQGAAGEFVFGQLQRPIRTDFKLLVKELYYRFRKIETSKSFEIKLRNRIQKPGEPVSDYAADLKKLYCKAFPQRGTETRREDLLRKFLDGLHDSEAKFHVEYIKEPADIDIAVCEVVRFQDTICQTKSRRTVKMVRGDDDEDDEAERIEVRQVKKNGPRPSSQPFGTKTKPGNVKSDNFEQKEVAKARDPPNQAATQESEISKLTGAIGKLMERMDSLEKNVRPPKGKDDSSQNDHSFNFRSKVSPTQSFQPVDRSSRNSNTFQCYRCGKQGHTSRYCRAQAPREESRWQPNPGSPSFVPRSQSN